MTYTHLQKTVAFETVAFENVANETVAFVTK
jgi:hypothetical protein